MLGRKLILVPASCRGPHVTIPTKANKFRFVAAQSQSATLGGPAFYFGVGRSTVVLWGPPPREVPGLASHFNTMLNWSSSLFPLHATSKTWPQDKDGYLN